MSSWDESVQQNGFEGVDESDLPSRSITCLPLHMDKKKLPRSNKNIDCSCRFIILQHLVILLYVKSNKQKCSIYWRGSTGDYITWRSMKRIACRHLLLKSYCCADIPLLLNWTDGSKPWSTQLSFLLETMHGDLGLRGHKICSQNARTTWDVDLIDLYCQTLTWTD
jgi:hypothetical protein